MKRFMKGAVGVFFLFFSIYTSLAQTCASNSKVPSEWPSHNHLFFGDGNVYRINSGTLTNFSGIVSYEGNSIASDDDGNLLFFTNGRRVYNAAGTETFAGLLSGNEGGGTVSGSAAQGVITVRHPLNPNDYYIFTTDDVLAPTVYGFNYGVFNSQGVNTQAVARIGAFNTTEGVAATLHANGVDIWITVQGYNSTSFYTYLLTCTGLNTTPVVSNVGFATEGNQARGGLAFSPDGRYFAAGHANFWPNSGKELMLFDFNNGTGVISNPRDCSPTSVAENIYDLVFSADNTKIYASSSQGEVHEYTITSGNAATIASSHNVLYTHGGNHTSIELGPGGVIYTASTAGLKRYSGGTLSPSLGSSNLGLSTRFLPPAESLEIENAPADMCVTDAVINLNTVYVCAGTSAEGAGGVYSGTGITNATTGVFNPATAGVGTHTIKFTRCALEVEIEIEVEDCGGCTAPTNLSVTDAEVCEGDDHTFTVTYSGTADDVYYITWYNNGGTVAKGPLTASTANANRLALTGIQASQDGTWTVRIEDGNNADSDCYTEYTFSLDVKPIPEVNAQSNPLEICSETATGNIALSATPTGASFTWTSTSPNITGAAADESTGASAIPTHSPSYTGAGVRGTITYSVIATLNDCPSDPEEYIVHVDRIPVANAGADQEICSSTATLGAINPAPLSGVWTKIDRGGTGNGPGTITSTSAHNSTLTSLVNNDSTYLSWTVSNGACPDSVDVVVIRVIDDEVPAVSLVASPIAVCSGDSIHLEATGVGTGSNPTYQFFRENTSIRNQDPANTYNSYDFTNTSTAPITVNAIVEMRSNTLCLAAGASLVVRDTVEITIDPLPSTSQPGIDQVVCVDTALMDAILPVSGTGAWQKVSGPGSIATTDLTDHQALVTGLNHANPTVYAWVISSENNLCPADSAVVSITRTADLTLADINGQSDSICASLAYPLLTGNAVNATATPAETGVWQALQGVGIVQTGNNAQITAGSMTAGNAYSFVYTISNGVCPDNRDTLTLTLVAPPAVSITPATASSCGTTAYNVSASASNYTSLLWSDAGSGGSFDPADEAVTDYTPTAANGSTYTLTITAMGIANCPSETASMDLTVHPGPSVEAGSDSAVCEGTTFDLTSRNVISTAADYTSLVWTANVAGGVFSDAAIVNPSYTPPASLSSGTVRLTLTANGTAPCNLVTDYFDLVVLPNPTVSAFAHQITPICETAGLVPARLVNNSNLDSTLHIFTWYLENPSGIDVVLAGPFTGTAATNLSLNNGDRVYLHADLITSVCPSVPNRSTTSVATVFAKPDLRDATVHDTYCVNDLYQVAFVDDESTGDPAYNPVYTWRDRGGNTLMTGSQVDYTDHKASPGRYLYELTAVNGLCSDVLSREITVRQPLVSVSADPDWIQQGETTLITGVLGNQEQYSYVWETSPSGMERDLLTYESRPDNTTVYLLRATLDNVANPASPNCTASASVEVIVALPPLPDEVFSPGNGDDTNEYWRIQHLNIRDYPNNVVRVFNRWGNVVYEGRGYDYDGEIAPEDADEKWNGTKNSELVPVATYYYVIELNDPKKTILSGAVTIIR